MNGLILFHTLFMALLSNEGQSNDFSLLRFFLSEYVNIVFIFL